MKPQSLVQLVGGGNVATVEDAWMRMIESEDISPEQLADYSVVLRELSQADQSPRAAAFAWAALETLSTRCTPSETLTVARPFLLAVGGGDDLRKQVAQIYRSAYPRQEGFATLLSESGLEGGRPVRRALRTLDLGLALQEGDFLLANDEDIAARVERIDRDGWRFCIALPDGSETLGAVSLADRFRPASANDFQVMLHFSPALLAKRLWKNPGPVLVDLCQRYRKGLDSDQLEAICVPELIPAADWKKWWTKARAALRRCPNIRIEGRSPYYLSYLDVPVALEEGLLKRIGQAANPLAQLEVVQGYLRECKLRGQVVCKDTMQRCVAHFVAQAKKLERKGSPQAGLLWIIAKQVAVSTGTEWESQNVVRFFRSLTDFPAVFAQITNDSLVDLACDCLVEASPQRWPELLLDLLPTLSQGSCDRVVNRLCDAGLTREALEPVVQRILASPLTHFEALLWLWNGPSRKEMVPETEPVTLLSRLIRALHDVRHSDEVSKETAKRMSMRARAVLSARHYERLDHCLDEIDAGMASALYTRIKQLDNLGRTVQEDILSRVKDRCPAAPAQPVVQPWEREDVIYVSPLGLERKRQDIDHHVNVKMKENAVAIGRAAERGDLSENSEYKFALEERDLLRARLAQMNSEMAQARLLDLDQIPTDHAGIGTKVVLKRVSDGQPYEITFVGPWEADPDKSWVNYKAPLANKVLGKRVGDVVFFDHSAAQGEYEIVALHNALAERN